MTAGLFCRVGGHTGHRFHCAHFIINALIISTVLRNIYKRKTAQNPVVSLRSLRFIVLLAKRLKYKSIFRFCRLTLKRNSSQISSHFFVRFFLHNYLRSATRISEQQVFIRRSCQNSANALYELPLIRENEVSALPILPPLCPIFSTKEHLTTPNSLFKISFCESS